MTATDLRPFDHSAIHHEVGQREEFDLHQWLDVVKGAGSRKAQQQHSRGV